MSNVQPHILVVSNSEEESSKVTELLALYNYEISIALKPAEALDKAKAQVYDSVLISLDMLGGGFMLSQKLLDLPGYEDVPFAFSTTAEVDYALLMEAQFYGGLFLFHLPYNECELLAQISTMIRLRSVQAALRNHMLELDTLASTDALTGLYNRRMFFMRFEEEIGRAERYVRPFCLVYMDIDLFKQINDTHGHLAGDSILQKIAETLGQQLRKSDVLGRVGGEEFLVLLPETPNKMGMQIADRLRNAVSRMQTNYEGTIIPVTISAGVLYVSHPGTQSMDEMIKCADEALYFAKESGRNRIVNYSKLQKEAHDPIDLTMN